jgi:hypothetical protein
MPTLAIGLMLDNDRASGEQERQVTGPKDEACGPERDGAQDRPRLDQQGLDELADAWIALWQSELAGLAADPEVASAWRQAFGLGASWLRAAGGVPSHERGSAAGDASPGPAPGSPPAHPASGVGLGDPLGGADAARLRARVDELERRLATLERGTAGGGADRSRPRRRRPSA